MKPLRSCKAILALGFLVLLSGCEASPRDIVLTPTSSGPAEKLGIRYKVDETGSIVGRIVWHGTIPLVEKIERLPKPLESPPFDQIFVRANMNAPRIDPATHGLADAVVFLRSVPLERARPWNHEPVTIEQRDQQIEVRQGPIHSRVGFVRRGTSVTMVSRDRTPHTLRLDGPRLTTLPFPDADSPLTRTLDRSGLVELSSGMGFYWMRGYLFVDDHPYYTRTDSRGGFVLNNVPAGSYELVCWHPSWRIAKKERNPDSAQIIRLNFANPLERRQQITVKPGEKTNVEMSLSSEPLAAAGP